MSPIIIICEGALLVQVLISYHIGILRFKGGGTQPKPLVTTGFRGRVPPTPFPTALGILRGMLYGWL